jgi:hypothetical protein
MNKVYVILVTVLFLATSAVGFAASGHRGGGSASAGQEGFSATPFVTPRNHGGMQDPDTMLHNRMFEEAAPGAWSNDPEPGKAKPSDEKK